MYLNFEEMPDRSRIWIYPANRSLTDSEVSVLKIRLGKLCDEWKAHGKLLKASYTIAFNRFIILAADEQTTSASGCSIDSSVHVIEEIGNHLQIDFFDRTQIPFLKDGKIICYPLKELKNVFSEGTIKGSDQTFNLLTSTKKDWQNSGIVTVGESWLSRYLTTPV